MSFDWLTNDERMKRNMARADIAILDQKAESRSRRFWEENWSIDSPPPDPFTDLVYIGCLVSDDFVAEWESSS